MHKNLGGAVAFDRFRHGADCLQRAELAALGPEAEGGDGLLDFVDHVGVLAVGMKSEVARPGAGIDAGSAKLGFPNLPGFFVELEHKHLVDAEVGCEGEFIVWSDVNGVRVGCLLTRKHARALVHNLRCHRPDVAVFLDRQNGGTATAVVGLEHVFAGSIHGEMARAGVAGWLLVELRELAVFHVQPERRDAAALFTLKISNLIHGVEKLAVGMNLEERGIAQSADGAEFFQAAVLQIQLIKVDAVLVGCRIAADADECLGGGGVRLAKREGCQYCNLKKCTECHVAR